MTQLLVPVRRLGYLLNEEPRLHFKRQHVIYLVVPGAYGEPIHAFAFNNVNLFITSAVRTQLSTGCDEKKDNKSPVESRNGKETKRLPGDQRKTNHPPG